MNELIKKNDSNTACNLIEGVDKPTPSARLLPIKMAIYNNRLDCIKLIAIISGKDKVETFLTDAESRVKFMVEAPFN